MQTDCNMFTSIHGSGRGGRVRSGPIGTVDRKCEEKAPLFLLVQTGFCFSLPPSSLQLPCTLSLYRDLATLTLTLKMEAIRALETLISIYQTTTISMYRQCFVNFMLYLLFLFKLVSEERVFADVFSR
jgi:hypothetical protein